MESVVVLFALALLSLGDALGTGGSDLGVVTCADSQPDVSGCRTAALQQAVQQLTHGIPNIGAEPIEPLEKLPPLTLEVNQAGINIRFTLNNARISGLGNSQVEGVRVDTAKGVVKFIAHLPGELVLEGDHTIEASVYGIQYSGSGRFRLVETDPKAEVEYSGRVPPTAGGYLQLQSVKTRLIHGPTAYQFTGVFGDYAPLVSAFNVFVNEVATPAVQPLIAPALQDWVSGIARERAQKVFSAVPFDELFPKK